MTNQTINQTIVAQTIETLKGISIDKRKKYFITVDVETTGGLAEKIVYDLGFAIHDRKGEILFEKSYLIDEIFNDEKLMSTAYYAKKVPQYRKDLENGLHELTNFATAREVFMLACAYFKPKTVMAYNLNFDMDALQKTAKRLMNRDKFLDVRVGHIEPKDIWSYACEVLFSQKSFAKFAFENGLYSQAGNYKTSAEVAYAYMTSNPHFEEQHTGLEDVRIEVEIFARCERQNKKHEAGILNHPWKLVTATHGKIVLEKKED